MTTEKRIWAAVFLALGPPACRGERLDLGGTTGATCPADAAVPASCQYSGPYSDGSGYFNEVPLGCGQADGAALSPSSTGELAAALVGAWTACSNVGPYPGANSSYIQFTSDGHFSLSAENADGAATYDGTFDVVDAASTLGPGTYQVRFTANDGSVSLTQVIAFSSPAKLRFFVPQAADYAPAQTWAFRAGVCGPSFDSDSACTSEVTVPQMQGRWIWCSGPESGLFFFDQGPQQGPGWPYIGLDISADGSWVALAQDTDGGIVPAPPALGALVAGTLSLGPRGSIWAGSEISSPSSSTSPTTGVEPNLPVIDACGRVLLPWPARDCACSNPDPNSCPPCPIDPTQSPQFVRVP